MADEDLFSRVSIPMGGVDVKAERTIWDVNIERYRQLARLEPDPERRERKYALLRFVAEWRANPTKQIVRLPTWFEDTIDTKRGWGDNEMPPATKDIIRNHFYDLVGATFARQHSLQNVDVLSLETMNRDRARSIQSMAPGKQKSEAKRQYEIRKLFVQYLDKYRRNPSKYRKHPKQIKNIPSWFYDAFDYFTPEELPPEKRRVVQDYFKELIAWRDEHVGAPDQAEMARQYGIVSPYNPEADDMDFTSPSDTIMQKMPLPDVKRPEGMARSVMTSEPSTGILSGSPMVVQTSPRRSSLAGSLANMILPVAKPSTTVVVTRDVVSGGAPIMGAPSPMRTRSIGKISTKVDMSSLMDSHGHVKGTESMKNGIGVISKKLSESIKEIASSSKMDIKGLPNVKELRSARKRGKRKGKSGIGGLESALTSSHIDYGSFHKDITKSSKELAGVKKMLPKPDKKSITIRETSYFTIKSKKGSNKVSKDMVPEKMVVASMEPVDMKPRKYRFNFFTKRKGDE